MSSSSHIPTATSSPIVSHITHTLTTTITAFITATSTPLSPSNSITNSTFNSTASINGTSTSSSSSISIASDASTEALYKTIGISLAVTSGVFIGSSFVFKKKGLLAANALGSIAGEGHAYLKNPLWWLGMILMVLGEICNFVAYAFTQAILVTPLGALSVVISAVLSSIFLQERLSFTGKIGCFHCIVGATIIVLHAPDQKMSESGIDSFMHLALSWGFLLYTALVAISSGVLIWWAGPRWGKKNMMVYIGICSLVGSLSVVTTQGLGNAIVNAITTRSWEDFTHPFLYFLIAFVVFTLLTEINYLNKALNLFCTAMVTPIYYVTFTSATMVASAILFQGFSAPTSDIITIVLGFLVICSGIVLLQRSKSTNPIKLDMTTAEALAPTSDDEKTASELGYVDPGPAEMRANPFDSFRRLSHRFSAELQAAQQDYVRRRSTSISTTYQSNGYLHTYQQYDASSTSTTNGKIENRPRSISNPFITSQNFESNWNATLLEEPNVIPTTPVPLRMQMRSLKDGDVGVQVFSPVQQSPSTLSVQTQFATQSMQQPSPTNPNNPYLNFQHNSASASGLTVTPSTAGRSHATSSVTTPLSSTTTLSSTTGFFGSKPKNPTDQIPVPPSPTPSRSSPHNSRLDVHQQDMRSRDRRSHSMGSHFSILDRYKIREEDGDREGLVGGSKRNGGKTKKSAKGGWTELDEEEGGDDESGRPKSGSSDGRSDDGDMMGFR